MIRNILIGILIWVIVGLLCGFLGSMLVTVNQAQIAALGTFLKGAAGVIGFLAGAWYVVTNWKQPQIG